MALNKYMHPKNIYRTRKPDFKKLSIKYPEFRQLVTLDVNGKVHLDFKNPTCLRGLTQTLLKDDFDLDVELPLDRLIPTVPQRLNYILWIDDMVGSDKTVRGIDIGTGASCIYPLLGCKLKRWSFLATEVDDVNLHYARKNVEKNSFQDKIQVRKVAEGSMLSEAVEDGTNYDFCMCNPPFFMDNLEAQGISNTRSDDRPEPASISTASEVESIAWGGEVAFVTKMIEDSLVLKDRIRVYTSLVGKKINLALLKDELRRRQVPHFSSTEFCQGKTMRWGLAWTFDQSVTFTKSLFQQQKQVRKPLLLELQKDTLDLDYSIPPLTIHIKAMLEALKIEYKEKQSNKFLTYLHLQASENTWSHQRRKRRQDKLASSQSQSTTTLGKGDNPIHETGDSIPAVQPERRNESEGKATDSNMECIEGNSAAGDAATDRSCTEDTGVVNDDTGPVALVSQGTAKRKLEDTETSGTRQKMQRVNTDPLPSGVETSNMTDIEADMSEMPEKLQDSSQRIEEDMKERKQDVFLFVCDLILKKKDGKITIELVYQSGSRELLYQMMQYLKNQFSSSLKKAVL